LSEKLITITGVDPVDILGANDANLRIIRGLFPKLSLVARGDTVKVSGAPDDIALFDERFNELIAHVARYNELPRKVLDDIMGGGEPTRTGDPEDDVLVYGNAGLRVKARTPNQQRLVEAVAESDMVFAIGPAGTGKTFLAVAYGATLLLKGAVDRLVVTRPAVEAGERLGFLPGDMNEKVDPYMAPIWQALDDILGPEAARRRRDRGEIEVAPLAFMRGRTLSHSFIIVDEAQNSTRLQMKMVLTRIGEGSRMVVTGDPSQVDLVNPRDSGLAHAVGLLKGVEGVDMAMFEASDVVRHPMVERIVRAYDADAAKAAKAREAKAGE